MNIEIKPNVFPTRAINGKLVEIVKMSVLKAISNIVKERDKSVKSLNDFIHREY